MKALKNTNKGSFLYCYGQAFIYITYFIIYLNIELYRIMHFIVKKSIRNCLIVYLSFLSLVYFRIIYRNNTMKYWSER